MIILERQQTTRFERSSQLAQVRFRFREKEKHPACEDQIVAAPGQGSLPETDRPDLPLTSAVPAAETPEPSGEDR